jgi:hypothetical protein
MKKILGLLCMACVIFTSCSKKTHPTVRKATRGRTEETRNNRKAADPTTNTIPPSGELNLPPAALAAVPMIVIDDVGRVITSRDKLPADVASKVDYSKISRSYTPAQRQNLIYRSKMVPPRVLYVPAQLASRNAKGTYAVYKKKFYYWKKEDGLFHLDEIYYQ